MSTPWPPRERAGHDELAARSTARLADLPTLDIPALDAPAPAGRIELVDGRGLFLRCTAPGPAAAPARPDTWYIHGLAGSSTNWTPLAGAMARLSRGFLIDLPGHGRSDPPPRGHYSIADMAGVVSELIRRRSTGPVHLVGNSLGGMVAVVLAAAVPDLVASLTLISPAVPDLRLTKDRGADPRLGLLLLPGTTGAAVRRLSALTPMERARGMARLCFGDPSVITAAQFEAAAADLSWRMALPWVHTATLASLRALLTSYLSAGAFGKAAAGITVPTLVIWGTRDALVDPRLAERTAQAFPNATVLMLAGVGHTAQMEAPETTARAIVASWDRAGESHSPHTPAVATSSA